MSGGQNAVHVVFQIHLLLYYILLFFASDFIKFSFAGGKSTEKRSCKINKIRSGIANNFCISDRIFKSAYFFEKKRKKGLLFSRISAIIMT